MLGSPNFATLLSGHQTHLLFLILCLSPIAESRGEDFKIFKDDRSGFVKSLTHNTDSSVIDTEKNFSQKPVLPTKKNCVVGKGKNERRVNSFQREGAIGANAYAYRAFDVNFDMCPRSERIGPEMFMDEGFEVGWLIVECPVIQDGVKGLGTWGLDSGAGNNKTRNAILLNFYTTPDRVGIGHFGADLIDFEASKKTPAELRLYDDGRLVFRREFDWGTHKEGHEESHFLGVVAQSKKVFFDQIIIILGDDASKPSKDEPNGFNEHWAADRFTFGQAYARE